MLQPIMTMLLFLIMCTGFVFLFHAKKSNMRLLGGGVTLLTLFILSGFIS
ncbi:hypothetical protein [Clostridium disporicum]